MVSSICSDPGYTTIAFTAAPIVIACLRLFRPCLRGFFCALCIATLAYAATAFQEHSLATIVTISFACIYCGFKLLQWIIIRFRMCRLGPGYILSSPNHVDSSLGRYPITGTGSSAIVTRRSGMTIANNQLIPDVKRMVLAGKIATKKGLVNLRKYGWQKTK
ncbi:M protein [Kafue kinda chacma baboon virus]|uniref:M protein n=1 Tax=Kafue kinda chacma baboon virus TaxID=1823757 RepID=A0A0Y0BIF0_9NIDO|nr:M protein [Kafue kinda chacma baboon virus]AMB20720.1 M protein [Kafue kinda chacma baboon virus]AMV49343.1 M protein [Kafue kinda chacma baboon virus]